MSDMSFDFSEIDKLYADLGAGADDAGKELRQAVEISARHVKDDWRQNVSSSRRFPGLKSAVSYDVHAKAGIDGSSITAEVGYDHGKPQGVLGHIAEYGNSGSAPRSDGQAALESNVEDFVKGIGKAADDAAKRHNL